MIANRLVPSIKEIPPMTQRPRIFITFIAGSVALLGLTLAAVSHAAQDIAPPESIPAPAESDPGYPPSDGEAVPGKCCYNPCIKYHYKRSRKHCCARGCKELKFDKINVEVPDPASCGCCVVEVPICVPTCCKGKPCVKDRCGMFGRGVVWYEWCCGYRVRVVFSGKECKGRNISVTYFGV